MITLSTNAKFDDLERLIDRIARPGNNQQRAITDGIRQQFHRNFTRQGSGAGQWAALRPMTVRQRVEQGYAGQRPILVRSGRYRASWVGRGGDNYERIQRSSFGITFDVGSNDDRADELERGTSRMRARPVSLLDDEQEAQLVRIIDYVVEQIERQIWR